MNANPFLALGVIILTSCARPDSLSKDRVANVPIPKRYDTTVAPRLTVSSDLLSQFGDPILRKYVKRALTNNRDLKSSFARLAEAGYNFKSTNSPLLPNLTTNGNFSRRKFANRFFYSIPPENSFDLTFNTNWEIDIWKRIRSEVSASASELQAARSDYAFARQSIAAQTMQAYMKLTGLEQRLKLNRDNLVSFKKTLTLVNGLFVDGSSELTDLNFARTDVENAKAKYFRLQNERDQAARQLRTLTGDYADKNLRTSGLPQLGKSIPAGLPSSLLIRRPDIDASYQRLRAADTRINVAHRALFPTFNLTAAGGRSALTLNELSNSNFKVWNIVGGFSAPIFENGRLRNELGAATKRAEKAYYDYQQIVLDAFREVENALGSELALSSQEKATESALDAARIAERGTLLDYEAGLVEILTLLEAQRRRFSTEEALIQVKVLRRQNRISLALALAKAV